MDVTFIVQIASNMFNITGNPMWIFSFDKTKGSLFSYCLEKKNTIEVTSVNWFLYSEHLNYLYANDFHNQNIIGYLSLGNRMDPQSYPSRPKYLRKTV